MLAMGDWVAIIAKQVGSYCGVLAARSDREALWGMNEHELKDIGPTRADVADATALLADVSWLDLLVPCIDERRRTKSD
jgi:uncharacterized protein YjiS (DUF1127 family)